MSSTNGHSHLQHVGGPRGVEFTLDDFEAMDLALALVPELRVSVLAVRLARNSSTKYPIKSSHEIAKLVEGTTHLVAGHKINAEEVPKYLIRSDFPVNNEAELASIVYIALGRCRHQELMRQNLELSVRSLKDNRCEP